MATEDLKGGKDIEGRLGPDARPDLGPEEHRVVKRYANRKLYDTTSSRYITLQQIAELVRNGEDVRIIDNRTKDDLTDVTLAQIIYEEQKTGEAKSVRTLRHLIQKGGERIMGTLRPGQRDRNGDPLEEGDEADLSAAKAETDEPRRPRPAEDGARSGTAMDHVRDLQAEVARLHARIETLEERLLGLRKGEASEAERAEVKPGDPGDGGEAPAVATPEGAP